MSAPCRRTEPYGSNKTAYRIARNTGQTAAQAAIIRKEIAAGRRVETEDGRQILDAKSNGGEVSVRTVAGWLTAQPFFTHPDIQ